MALFVVSGFTVLQAAGSGSGDEAALKAIEEKWDAASLKGDAAALSSIFADGFISTSPEGKVRTKAEVLAQIKAGEIKYNVAKVEDMKVYLHGDSAVVSGKWKGNFVEKGKTTDSTERFTDMFVRQNGQWRCVASHASPLK
jgi:ketosteroid isomerase-like protein